MKTPLFVFAFFVFLFGSAQVPCNVSNGFNDFLLVPAPCSNEALPVGVYFYDNIFIEAIRGDVFTFSGLLANGSYRFSLCESFVPTQPWPVEILVYGPDNNLVASGTDDGSNCELSFVALIPGTYTIYVQEVGGACPPETQFEDNGRPQFFFEGGSECPEPVEFCFAGTGFLNGSSDVCPGQSVTYNVEGYSVPDTPDPGILVVCFNPVPGSGTGGLFFGDPFCLQQFDILPGQAGDISFSLTNTLENLLEFPLFNPLEGSWNINVEVQTFETCSSSEPVQVNFLPSGGICAAIVCDAGTNVSTELQSVCPTEPFNLAVTDTEVSNASFIFEWVFQSNADPSQFGFLPFQADQPSQYGNLTLTQDQLNAQLTAFGQQPLGLGVYNVFGRVFDANGSTGSVGYCSQTELTSLTFVESNDPSCNTCAAPFPQVDNESQSFEVLPNGNLRYTWAPIIEPVQQIGCQVQIAVGDPSSPDAFGSFVLGGPNVGQFTISANQLTDGTQYTARSRCGCSLDVIGPFSNPITTIYQTNSELSANSSAEKSTHFWESNELWENIPFYMSDHVNSAGMYDGIDPRFIQNPVNMEDHEIKVFPNPAQGRVNVKFYSSKQGIVNLRLYNIVGQVILERTAVVGEGENFLYLNADQLEQGLYLVELQANGNKQAARVQVRR